MPTGRLGWTWLPSSRELAWIRSSGWSGCRTAPPRRAGFWVGRDCLLRHPFGTLYERLVHHFDYSGDVLLHFGRHGLPFFRIGDAEKEVGCAPVGMLCQHIPEVIGMALSVPCVPEICQGFSDSFPRSDPGLLRPLVMHTNPYIAAVVFPVCQGDLKSCPTAFE